MPQWEIFITLRKACWKANKCSHCKYENQYVGQTGC